MGFLGAAAAVDHGLTEIVRATAGIKMPAAAIRTGQRLLFGFKQLLGSFRISSSAAEVAGHGSSGLTHAAVAAVCCLQAGWRLWL
jgi:hypothetical protein